MIQETLASPEYEVLGKQLMSMNMGELHGFQFTDCNNDNLQAVFVEAMKGKTSDGGKQDALAAAQVQVLANVKVAMTQTLDRANKFAEHGIPAAFAFIAAQGVQNQEQFDAMLASTPPRQAEHNIVSAPKERIINLQQPQLF